MNKCLSQLVKLLIQTPLLLTISANLCSHGYFVAKEAGVILGYAYGSQYRPRPAYNTIAEVSVYLAPQAKGCGLARAL